MTTSQAHFCAGNGGRNGIVNGRSANTTTALAGVSRIPVQTGIKQRTLISSAAPWARFCRLCTFDNVLSSSVTLCVSDKICYHTVNYRSPIPQREGCEIVSSKHQRGAQCSIVSCFDCHCTVLAQR
ncbi:hypothetical protein DPMN_102915 [Dreissena polymorpha]|uniref:Uncharacterized protein n=1 Tax=Dreissena polymorpha TaxID=45954 RepID=A0A9D4K251_DREPO|nr:hypothetical protein DPMN_102915 [Dreissena polymorpha]